MARTYIQASDRRPEPKAAVRAKPTVAELTRPAGSPEARLADAAETALEFAATDRALRIGALGVVKAISRARPVFMAGGRGLRAAKAGVRDGVYVDRGAAVDRGLPEDLENLVRFDDAVRAKPWKAMSRRERVALSKATGGWQELPTGEVVKQLPKFNYVAKAWAPYEGFAGKARSAVSRFAEARFPEGERPFSEMIEGPGADELFAYYPELKGAKLSAFVADDPAVLGKAGAGRVGISDRTFAEGVKEVTNTIHHEPQHLVQRASGHGPGSNPTVAKDIDGAIGALKTDAPTGAASAENAARIAKMEAETAKLPDPAYARYQHASGEAGAFAVGRTSTEGAEGLVTDAMKKEGIAPGLVYRLESPGTVEEAAKLRRADAALARLKNEMRQDSNGGRTEEAIGLALPFVKEHERFRGEAYWDPVGEKWTVGYGQTQIAGKDGVLRDVVKGDVIDEPTSAKFVESRLRENAAAIAKNLSWSANASPRALAALYDIAYNAGVATLDSAKGHSPKLNEEAASAGGLVDQVIWNHVPTYKMAGGKVVQGLVNRRADALRVFRDEPANALPFKEVRTVANAVPVKASAKAVKPNLKAYEKPAPDLVKIRENGKDRWVKRSELGHLGWSKRAAESGGAAEGEPTYEQVADTVDSPVDNSGPRIVVNPTTFRNKKDALCVAFNERFRIAMEQYGWEPQSEPTPAQRRFFADTAYADDEVMLRRTIIARILTLDTSIS